MAKREEKSGKGIGVVIIVLISALATGIGMGVKMGSHIKEQDTDVLSEWVQMLDVDEVYVNLKDGEKIAKVSVSLAVAEKEKHALMEERVHIVKDEINKCFREKTPEDVEGDAGQEELKKELMGRLNKTFQTESVKGVFFNTLLIQ